MHGNSIRCKSTSVPTHESMHTFVDGVRKVEVKVSRDEWPIVCGVDEGSGHFLKELNISFLVPEISS